MSGHKSVGQRIKSARSRIALASLLRDWSQEWENGHRDTMAALDAAIDRRDWDSVERAARQLYALHDKKFASLPGVVRKAVESLPE
ncbi:hypothetical protein ACF3MZ_21230 [Paenibacillaceae bacterium WGS1546]|uniref:hypothetical protein n=1 Tax=Cohnella sp. WGS1546 TaxID=3366810 RepID=UPI00372D7C5A